MKPILFIFLFLVNFSTAFSQGNGPKGVRLLGADSVVIKKSPLADSSHKKHSPRLATIRSAIIPGWGQAYNGKYWKIPLVYAGLGITGAVFNFNLKQYKKARFAYFTLINNDTANFKNVDAQFQPAVQRGDSYSLESYRSSARQYVDYSVLFFLLFWGLNVVDATVDGHLHDFNITDDLSLKIKPTVIPAPGSTYWGISCVFTIGKNRSNSVTLRP